MSRLTASPFNKPSPFQFPRVPLSPPETNSDHVPASSLSASVSVAGGIDGLPNVEPDQSRSQSSDSPSARFRRGLSSLAYHSSGLRDARERGVSRNYRYFVIVVPPPAFVQDHGQLGHTLSLGPQHRLGQGMLMPLFPTMYAQLSAIAREFNFPSTTGLCLYLHVTDNGVTSTPRISDDSWQLIWNHIFEASSPSTKIPVVGKIEFDLDLRQARWYGAWLSSSHREQLDVPSSVVPSTAPSLSHFRMDSRATELDLTIGDDTIDNPSHESSVPTVRHIPRKLSLVDRLDSVSTRSGPSRPPLRPSTSSSPPANNTSPSVLSPIFQEDEPKTATLSLRGDLQSKVNIWRASANLNPSSLAARGQTSLDPANLPNTISLDAVMHDDDGEDDELNLEDFAWSVSSLGPPDYDNSESITSWDRVLSVHMDRRAEGSVCLTPSDCTSFGPSDYTLPPLSPPSERAWTPDLAGRMYEDAPLSPATATSWGPSSDLEWPPSPLSEGGISSVDFTYRMQLSRPPTPATATSWGAPSEWPASPMSDGRVSSVDFTYRMQMSRPQTPSTATSWGPASWPASPATPFYVHTPDAGQRSFDLDVEEPSGAVWRHVWPYTQKKSSTVPKSNSSPWDQVWPYRETTAAASRSSGRDDVSVYIKGSYPSLVIYQHVYPYFNLYPPVAHASGHVQCVYPHFNLYPSVANTRRLINVQVSERLDGSSQYPVFNLYPAVYPWNLNEIYSVAQPELFRKSVVQSQGYPDFQIYPAIHRSNQSASRPWNHVWPYQMPNKASSRSVHVVARPWNHGWPYWTTTKKEDSSCSTQVTTSSHPWNHVWPYTEKASSSVSVYLPCSYPSLQIYRAVYPCFDLYPALPRKLTQDSSYSTQVSASHPWNHVWPYTEKGSSSVSVYLPCSYPSFQIYRAVYPCFDLYPALPRKPTQVHYPHFDLYPAIYGVKQSPRQSSIHVSLPSSYPVFDIYKAVYPYNLEEVYPAIQLSAKFIRQNVISRSRTHGYPDFEIYPAIKSRGYPDFDIYPAHMKKRGSSRRAVEMKLLAKYPYFDLYPAVYPHIMLYPSGDIVISRKSTTKSNSNGPKSRGYPDFEIYPAVKSSGYPDFCIYPPMTMSKEKTRLSRSSATAHVGYPDFIIYPPVNSQSIGYPDFCIYPPMSMSKEKTRLSRSSAIAHIGYPDFVIYPPVNSQSIGYPDFCIYPPMTISEEKNRLSKSSATAHVGYPDFVIYPPVNSQSIGYPDFCIYPPIARWKSPSKRSTTTRSSGYPDFDIYPASKSVGYPDFCLYPPSSGRKVQQQRNGVIDMKLGFFYPFFNIYPGVYPTIMLYPPRSGEIEHKGIYVKHSSRYPVFDLYPAVYPHIVPYPRVICLPTPSLPKMVQTAVAKQVKSRRSRLTHAQLHALVWASGFPQVHRSYKALHDEVFANGVFATPSGSNASPDKLHSPRVHKSHRAVHDEVFASGIVDTPSGGTESRESLQTLRVDTVLRPRARAGSIARRPPSGAPPVRGLPPRPDSFISTSPEDINLLASPASSQGSRSSNSPSPSLERTRSSPTSSPVHAPVPPVRRRVNGNGLPPRPNSFLELRDSQAAEPARALPRTVSATNELPMRTSSLQRSASTVSASRPTDLRTTTLQRSASSVSRPPTVELRTTSLQRSMSSSRTTSIRKGPVHLSPVDERPPQLPALGSLDTPFRSSLDRSLDMDTPSRPQPPKKRDSLVMQRARAFESNEEEPILSKFPLPPRPTGPSLSSRFSSHTRPS
ncbi:hypothetical protein D9758_001014 [Tetrapyrgos nigripes]|uniref:Uncharacterized protein n=1 Tax=Tetrapyrgos nigripes TaxID=182062 RepID=A0A8H5LUJ0_9AGAR|nr:hypothetical protein D9758_001014 [Tetrapyrgos nigripes]